MEMNVDDRASALVLKEELVSSLDRWRAMLPAGDDPRSTLWFGIADRAITLGSALLRAVVTTMFGEEPASRPPTLGDRIVVIERRAQNLRTRCSSSSERLVTKTDIAVLHRFSRLRNDLARQEDRQGDAAMLGRFTPTRVAEILDIAESIAHLTITTETICLQAFRASTNATLIVNDDHSRCGSCGRSADPREATHLTVMWGDGPSDGCGAKFVSVSSDKRITPRLREAIVSFRPDLPFAGDAPISTRC
jgi:hypothetical protein